MRVLLGDLLFFLCELPDWLRARARQPGWLELPLAMAIVVYLAVQVEPLLTNAELAGWDLTAHYTLTQVMSDLLASGRLRGYDPHWFAGYPSFTFYAPGYYVLVALPHLLTGGLLPLRLCFNAALALLPFLYLGAFYTAARTYLGPRAGAPALLFGFVWLTSGPGTPYTGIGLSGLVTAGLAPGFLGICLYTFLLAALEAYRQRGTRRRRAAVAGLLAALACVHTLTLLLGALTTVLFALLHRRRLRGLALASLVGAAVSSFVWWPLLAHVDLASATAVGRPVKDPLSYLLTRLNADDLRRACSGPRAFLSYFPACAAALAVTIPCGIRARLREGRSFLPVAFLAFFLILPRDLLEQVLDLPVHYYRFTAHLVVIGHLLAVAGCLALLDAGAARLGFRWRGALTVGALALALWLGWEGGWRTDLGRGEYGHGATTAGYPDHTAAERVLEFLEGQRPQGRVAVEPDLRQMRLLGSAHYFASALPAHGLSYAQGLLVESSLSASFLVPSLARGEYAMVWGRMRLLGLPSFRELDMAQSVERLSLYGVQYLITISEPYRAAYAGVEGVRQVYRRGPFAVLRLDRFAPLLRGAPAPRLFVPAGGPGFREFAEDWYAGSALAHPVVCAPWDSIDPASRAALGGVILSVAGFEQADPALIARWEQRTGRPVLLYDGRTHNVLSGDARQGRGMDLLAREPLAPPGPPPRLELREDQRLRFTAEGWTWIDLSYFPRWRCPQGRTVFWATPSLMLVCADGETELRYD